ncbi:MAG: tetratricopeptide repeat protein [Deltaproteobacteria bacterium]|nr:tetratricopeptide repeat protein [Deltaproteobacteria bacterium]
MASRKASLPPWTLGVDLSEDPQDDPALELRERGDLDGAERVARKALAKVVARHGPDHPDTLALRDSLAATLMYAGRIKEAEVMVRESGMLSLMTYGPDDPGTNSRMMNKAIVGFQMGYLDDAEKIFQLVYEFRFSTRGPDDPQTLLVRICQAVLRAERGQVRQAVDDLLEILRVAERGAPPGDPVVMLAKHNLKAASARLGSGKGPGLDG